MQTQREAVAKIAITGRSQNVEENNYHDYSETCPYDHLRIRGNLGIKDSNSSP